MPTLPRPIVLETILCCAMVHAQAQPASLDPAFNVADAGFRAGDGTAAVLVVVALPDGKTLIGGTGTTYNGDPMGRVGRVNDNGLLDLSFATGTGANNTVRAIAVRPDGKILIGGDFTSFNGVTRNRIARLNADGSLDTGFDPGTGPDAPVHCIALQPDGGIVIGGEFQNYNTTPRSRIARLNTDGALDGAFDPGSGANNVVRAIALQADGKVMLGGEFAQYNGTARSRIARCNANGTLDSSFNPGTGLTYGALAPNVQTIKIQPDGKILFAGQFTAYNGTTRMRIARVETNGMLDPGFDPGTGTNRTLYSLALQPDGKILIGGDFLYYNGVDRRMITRLNPNGSLDLGFGTAVGADDYVLSIAVRPDGKITIGGYFPSYHGTGPSRCARLNADGSLDPTFNRGSAANAYIYTTALQPNGKILIGGVFTTYHGVARNRIARLNADGTPDLSFNPGTGANNPVNDILVQPDGKIIIVGGFDQYNGTTCNRIVRLNPDGSLEPGFPNGAGPGSSIHCAALQPDGKILLGGLFATYNGATRRGVVRLNADGTLDSGFDAGVGISSGGWVNSLSLQPDGRILIGGWFNSYNGTSRINLARLNANGTLDASFDPGTSTNNTIVSSDLLPDGKFLVGGAFVTYNGTSVGNLVRLNPNGSLDTSFQVGTGANGTVTTVTSQPDGKLLIGGVFTTVADVLRIRIARLHADGSLDMDFDPGTGFDTNVEDILVQPDGMIIVGGQFTVYNGTGRNRIARLRGSSTTPSLEATVFLGGPYTTNAMNDGLRTLPTFPLSEPFTARGYVSPTFTPHASIPSSRLSITGNDAIVDWVLVEMRPVSALSTIAASRAVLLQRDGDVVDLDGISPMSFPGLVGSHCVTIRSRNHLPVMSAPSNPVNYGSGTTSIDFSLPATAVFDEDARMNIGGTMVVAGGDVNFNGTVQYAGNGNDRDPVLARIGGIIPTNTVNGYFAEDVNMDGEVKYTGSGNDRDVILQCIGGIVPTNTRVASLP